MEIKTGIVWCGIGQLLPTSSFFEINYQVCPLILLFNARKDNVGSRDAFLRILKIFHQDVLSPGDASVLTGIREPKRLICILFNQTMEIWPYLELVLLFQMGTGHISEQNSFLSQHSVVTYDHKDPSWKTIHPAPTKAYGNFLSFKFPFSY